MFEFILQGLDSVMIKQMLPVRTYGSYWPNDRGVKLCRIEPSNCEGGLWAAFSDYRDNRTQVPEIYKKRKGSPWKEEFKRNKKNIADLQPLERKMLMATQVPVTSNVPAWQVFRPVTRSKK